MTCEMGFGVKGIMFRDLWRKELLVLSRDSEINLCDLSRKVER
jgi:hypothetical protein